MRRRGFVAVIFLESTSCNTYISIHTNVYIYIYIYICIHVCVRMLCNQVFFISVYTQMFMIHMYIYSIYM